jgi:hypothetical protein
VGIFLSASEVFDKGASSSQEKVDMILETMDIDSLMVWQINLCYFWTLYGLVAGV